MNYITFDIETYDPTEKLDRIDTNIYRVSVTGAYISWLDKYLAFLEEDTKDFLELLRHCDVVIGYNHIGFDLPVLQKYAHFNLLELNNYDLMLKLEEKAGYKPRLDDVANLNLGRRKTDSYSQYRYYHKEGKWLELIDYCMNDVQITEKIAQRVMNSRGIIVGDNLHTQEVFLSAPRAEMNRLEFIPESIF